MAIENIDVAGVASTAMDTASTAATYGLWGLFVIVVVIVLGWLLQHRHVVSVRLLTRRGASKPIKDRAREVMVDGVTYWRLLKRKAFIPVPPSEALIDTSNGGKPKYYCEFTYSEETGYVPLVYDITSDNFSEKVVVVSNGKVLENAFHPFTPQQRALLVSQFRKAEARKKKSFMEQLTAIATPVVLVMMLLGVLLFWEDIAKPAKEMATINKQMLDQNEKITNNLAEISNQNARVVSVLYDEDLAINQRVQAGGGG